MPNLIINTQESSGNISSITFPQLVLILSFLKKKGEIHVRVAGYNPSLHPEIKKIIEVIRRGGFQTTISLPSKGIVEDSLPENISKIELIAESGETIEEKILEKIHSHTNEILLEFEIPSKKADYDTIVHICKKYNISHIRYRLDHPKFGDTKISSLSKSAINDFFDHIIAYKDSLNITFNCGISKNLFTPEQRESLTNCGFLWNEGCFGYAGRYDIYPNGEIKKCSSLARLYGIDGLRLENFETEDDLFEAIEIKPLDSGCVSENPPKKTEKKPFDDYPGFYEEDNRKNRKFLRTTKELIEKKNAVVLPPELVKGKSVLDLGSCIGAMGQWALFYGAKSYTGVEIQESYVEISTKLLSHHGDKVKIIQSTLEKFLSSNTEKFDIILCLGVIYVTIDYYSVLKGISEICNEFAVIESFYPSQNSLQAEAAGVVFVSDHGINLSTQNGSLIGRGTHISPNGLDFIMRGLSMEQEEGILQPKKIYQGIDSYKTPGVGRYMLRFHKSKKGSALSLSEKLERGIIDKTNPWQIEPTGKNPIITTGSWEFGSKISKEFFDHAKNHIPQYEETVNLCLKIIEKYFPNKDSRILEFGSAIGYTLERLHQIGYSNILGIEKSEDMYKQSALQKNVIIRDVLDKEDGVFSVILANWTLHFIQERETILESFYNQLEKGGIVIITDKVASSQSVHELYLDFKRSNGLSENEIETKTRSLKGVLFPYDVTWYLMTLKKIGFSNIDIITASPSFITFLIQK